MRSAASPAGSASSRAAIVVAQPRHRCDSSSLRARRLAEPERDASAAAPCASSTRTCRLDAQDAVGRVAELEHVAGQALDREVLVDRADDVALAAPAPPGSRRCRGSCRRRSARSAARRAAAQHAVHGVAVDQRAAPAAPGAEALGQHAHDGSSNSSRVERRGTARRAAQRDSASSSHSARATSATICCASTSSGCSGIARRSSSPRRTPSSSAAHSTSSSRDSGNSRPFGVPPTAWPERPTRCRKAAIERGEPSWQTRSTSPMSMPSSSDAVATSALQLAALQALLGVEPLLLAPGCRGARRRAPRRAARTAGAPTRSAMRRVLTKTSVVRCAAISSREAVVDLLPDLARHHRFERRGRQLEREVARAAWPMSTIVQSARRLRPLPAPTRKRATSSIGFCVADRPMRSSSRRRTARRAARATAPDGAALVRRQRVDLVDDDRARGRQHRAAGLRAEQDVERLRRRHQDVRRAAGACASRSACGVSPVRTAVRISTSGRPSARQLVADAGERRLEVALDVVRQRLQRRDVDDLRLVRELPVAAPAAPAHRSPRGTRPASCPSRSARRPACGGRPGSPARPRLRRRRRGERRANQERTAGWKRSRTGVVMRTSYRRPAGSPIEGSRACVSRSGPHMVANGAAARTRSALCTQGRTTGRCAGRRSRGTGGLDALFRHPGLDQAGVEALPPDAIGA